jgi:SAM-dependent methyltransferase
MGIESWSEADAYEQYVGRWSRPIAREFVVCVEAASGGKWLDVGCGTGALSENILQHAQPVELLGIDRSADYVSFARKHVTDARAKFEAGDATALPVADDMFDVAVSGLMLNFIPEPRRAVEELVRVTRPGGTAAAYVWDYAAGMQMIRYFWDVAAAIDPGAAGLDEGSRFPICEPNALQSLFDGSALSDVVVTAIDVPTRFRSFEDYWSPFLGGQGPAPGYVASLPESNRAELRNRLQKRLAVERDGAIHLTARAWAVKGTKRPRFKEA